MKLVIAGSRHFDVDELRNCFEINQTLGLFDIDWPKQFVHGGCPTGTDAWANHVTDEYWDTTPTKVFKAEWEKYGNRAGPLRNKKMAVYGDALLLIWDGESRGSKSMKEAMLELKKPVYEIILKSHNVPPKKKVKNVKGL